MYTYIYIYILRTLTRHRRTSRFSEIWVLRGDAGFSALFAPGRLGWLLLGCFSGPVEIVFCSPGRHFESFVLPWGEPNAPGAPHRQTFE